MNSFHRCTPGIRQWIHFFLRVKWKMTPVGSKWGKKKKKTTCPPFFFTPIIIQSGFHNVNYLFFIKPTFQGENTSTSNWNSLCLEKWNHILSFYVMYGWKKKPLIPYSFDTWKRINLSGFHINLHNFFFKNAVKLTWILATFLTLTSTATTTTTIPFI